MNANHSPEFYRRLVILAEIYDVKMSPQRQALYFEALRDLEFDIVVKAMNAALQACKFLPRPAEIRQLALGDSEDQTETAWVQFRQAMKQVGSYASVTFADPALGESVLALFGSWDRACSAELSPEMWASKRKEFGRVYRVMKGRHLDGVRYLPGICETTNMGRADWQKFVPLSLVGTTGEIKALPRAEVEQERTQIAAKASGFSDLRSIGSNIRLEPISRDDIA